MKERNRTASRGMLIGGLIFFFIGLIPLMTDIISTSAGYAPTMLFVFFAGQIFTLFMGWLVKLGLSISYTTHIIYAIIGYIEGAILGLSIEKNKKNAIIGLLIACIIGLPIAILTSKNCKFFGLECLFDAEAVLGIFILIGTVIGGFLGSRITHLAKRM